MLAYESEEVISGWIKNSGAIHHLINSINNLTDSVPYTSEENVAIGNGSSLSSRGHGSTSVNCLSHTNYVLLAQILLHTSLV